VKLRAGALRVTIPLEPLAPDEQDYDEQDYEAWFPDLREPIAVWLGLEVDGRVLDERTLAWNPQRHWDVHLVHYSHHDLGYTDLPSHVLREYDGILDQVLRFCEETADWPDADAQFRYQCEQAWSVVHYVENRPQEAVDRLMAYVRQGQIEVTALFGNQTLELCDTETLVRLLYPAFRLRREYGIPITSAEHNDIPGFPWGLASVLAGAGIRYFSPGVPSWYFGEGEDRVHPLWDPEEALPLEIPAACWWEGPDGAQVLLWSDLHGMSEWQPYNYEEAFDTLPGLLTDLEAHDYPYDMVSYTLRGGHRDNAPASMRYAYMVREWNRRWAYPRLVNTTKTPFLRAFERRWGDELVTLRGDVPGTDYPVAATSTPRETAIDRNTHTALTAAETWATLASHAASYDYPSATLDRAERETFFYDLHCWGLSHVAGPAQDAHWSEKGGFACRAAALAHDVKLKAVNALADEIAYPDEGYYVTVFNPLAYERADVVRIPLRTLSPCGSPMFWRSPEEGGGWPRRVSGRAHGRKIVDPPISLLEKPFKVIDASTGDEVAYQISTLDTAQAARRWAPERWALGKVDGRHRVDIVIVPDALPSVGYKTYKIVSCDQGPTHSPYGVDDPPINVVETDTCRLEFDPGVGQVVSLYDKRLGRELIDKEADHAFGELIVRSSETGEEAYVAVREVSIAESGPLYTTLRLQGSASCCPRVTVEITLYHKLSRIDLQLRILRDSTPMRELYVAFPFLVDNPQFRFAGPGSVIEPIRDQWPGSNTDYYGVQPWVNVDGRGWGITWTPLDTPIAEVGGLWPGYVSGAHHGVRGPGYGHPFLRAGELQNGHIYAMVSYNNFRTNFINVKPDEYVVRYVMWTHKGDWREGRVWQAGLSATSPPVAVWMHGPQKGVAPLMTSSCHVDVPNVVVTAFKRAEDDDGFILRLMETAGRDTQAAVTFPGISIRHALETDLVEVNRRVLTCSEHQVRVALSPYAIRTLRLRARL
jgi:hypothetical protein